ncbi:MAG TPA: TatD family hydrolase, partial [Burkholderiales bacterium]
MQLVDIGANLAHASFRDDLDAVLSRAHAHGVERIIVTGASVEESRRAADIADAHGLYATAGVHPHHARECGSETLAALRSLAALPRVVALGECGLDFNRNYSPHPDQEKWFVAQLELACELAMPLFLHSRDAHPRFAEILKNLRVARAVAHCFTGGAAELRAYLDLGLYIGITGWICD